MSSLPLPNAGASEGGGAISTTLMLTVTAAELAVDSEIEHSEVAEPAIGSEL
jgi:hypothetical protein